MMSVLTFLLTAVYIVTCFFLIFVVLIQKGEGGGLGGIAGGAAVDTAFGAKADMTWKRATGVAAAIFVSLSLVLGVLKRPQSVTKSVARPTPAASQSPANAPTPAATQSPASVPTPAATPSPASVPTPAATQSPASAPTPSPTPKK